MTLRSALSSSFALWDTALAVSGDISTILQVDSADNRVTSVMRHSACGNQYSAFSIQSGRAIISQNGVGSLACGSYGQNAECRMLSAVSLHKLRGPSGEAFDALGDRRMG